MYVYAFGISSTLAISCNIYKPYRQKNIYLYDFIAKRKYQLINLTHNPTK